MKYLKLAAVTALFTGFMPSIVLAQAPKIWTAWDYLSASQGQCMRQSINAVRDYMGFQQNFEILENGVYGENGSYSVTIRCAKERNFVFFITAGPSTEVAEGLLNDLMRGYESY